jgi:urea transport system substrate-binding protein
MKPTPTQTRCPSPDDLRRLLLGDWPEADAARLRDHLRDCPACQQAWQTLRGETVVSPTPPILEPAHDTTPGVPVAKDSAPSLAWSSAVDLPGPGGNRPPAPPRAPSAGAPRTFSFLTPPQEASEIGWLGSYRITGLLGEGGMGYVFDAFETHLQRRVALKVLKPELAANLSFRERFLHEARAAAQLPDEYIITIYQVGLENDVPYLAMKYLYGESLEQRIQSEGSIPTHEVLRIGREVALGLSAAHDRGLIHRDIKPANLWLETPPPEQGASSGTRLSCEYLYRVKILDFGLARPVNDSRRLTATGLIVGTPSYLAPEQARGLPLDHRCDLFALGCVLYRMVTGILPFDGPDTLAQLTALAVQDPRPVEEIVPDVPDGLRNLIHQLLARDPSNRPATARAVAEALRTLEKDEALTREYVSLPAPARASRKPERGQVSSARRRWFVAGGVLGLLLLGGILLGNKLRPGRAEDPSPAPAENAIPAPGKDTIKVGVLFSLRGPMQNGGSAAHDAAQLAIEELNEQGGVLGRPVEALAGDGKSDYREFEALAKQFITRDRVAALFGCRASTNRKAVKPIVEQYDALLFYPMQFEGLEDSPNIVYLGAAPNQQMMPAIKYMLEKQNKRRLFLVGSDYVFPRAANAILRDFIRQKYPEAKVVGENYIPFGSSDVHDMVRAIAEEKPDLIVNTINGDSNSAFFRGLHQAGLRADSTPVLSFSLGENDLLSLGEAGVGHYSAWSYFQNIDRPENAAFVRRFQKRFGERRVVSDPMETVYFGIHLWAKAVQEAGSVETHAVLAALKGRSLSAPEGDVRVDEDTHYTWRAMRVGKVGPDGKIQILHNTTWAIQPDPFPSSRPRAEWEKFLEDLFKGWGDSWQAPPG